LFVGRTVSCIPEKGLLARKGKLRMLFFLRKTGLRNAGAVGCVG
jgi:hypothetical protein